MTSIAHLMNLRGRVALITGASGGIGRAICEGLAELGCDLALVDRDMDILKKQAEQLRSKFAVEAHSYCIDLEIEEERIALHESIDADAPRLDILINNAAFVGDSGLTGWGVSFEDQEIATWRRAVEVNLTACFHLSQLLAPLLRQHQVGSIINIGSIYGIVGPDMGLYEGTSMGNPAAYAASKGGLVQLTNWLATTLAPQIRVNCVSPGGIFRNQPEEFVERYLERTPMGRMATERDISGAIAFLSSPISSYITGHNLVVDGGWTAW